MRITKDDLVLFPFKIFAALDNAIKSKMVRRSDGSFGCTDCDYVTKYNTTCQNHIESKHLSTSGVSVNIVKKFCPTRNALKSQTTKDHKEKILKSLVDFLLIRSR